MVESNLAGGGEDERRGGSGVVAFERDRNVAGLTARAKEVVRVV